MSKPPSISEVCVESVVFLPVAKPLGSDKTLFLGGAGVRGVDIEGKFVKVTAIGVYLEDGSVTEQGKAVIKYKLLGEAILESIIGKHGVSPTTRQSLAARVSEFLMHT